MIAARSRPRDRSLGNLNQGSKFTVESRFPAEGAQTKDRETHEIKERVIRGGTTVAEVRGRR